VFDFHYFVVCQPENGKIVDFDHVIFWVGNAKQVGCVWWNRSNVNFDWFKLFILFI